MVKKGSYTVEAALLMCVLLPILVGVIYLGFYLHDKAMLQGAAFETAVYASLFQGEEEQKEKTEKKKEAFLKGSLMGIRDVEGKVKIQKKKVTVTFQGELPIPGFAAGLFGKRVLKIKEQVSLKLETPRKDINYVRNIEKLLGSDEK